MNYDVPSDVNYDVPSDIDASAAQPLDAARCRGRTDPRGAPGTSPVTSGEPDADTADPSAVLLAQLDELGVPPDASWAQHRARLTQTGVRVRDHRLAETIRPQTARKRRR